MKMIKRFEKWFNHKFAWFFTNGRKINNEALHIDGMDCVAITLHDAKLQGLETEVVTWALIYMKNNPSLSISEAITMGYYEWVK